MVASRLAPAVLAVILAACGSSGGKEDVDALEARCLALPGNGATYAAAVAMLPAPRTPLVCEPPLAPLPGGTCQPTAENPECQVFFEVFTPDYCGQFGCCHFCEVRVLQQSTSPDLGAAPICATRFYRKQPCQ
jgi:hypothetical protein